MSNRRLLQVVWAEYKTFMEHEWMKNEWMKNEWMNERIQYYYHDPNHYTFYITLLFFLNNNSTWNELNKIKLN